MEELDPHGILMGYTVIRTLVGGDWNMTGLFSHILGMSSSQLTTIFQRASNHQPELNWREYVGSSPTNLAIDDGLFGFMIC